MILIWYISKLEVYKRCTLRYDVGTVSDCWALLERKRAQAAIIAVATTVKT